MITKIKKNVWQLVQRLFGSHVYLIKLKDKNILIDTDSPANRIELKEKLQKLDLKPEDIDIVILTHNHFDHTGNINLFKNAKIYGRKNEFKAKKIIDIDKLDIKELRVIKTPGHTGGSICIFYDDVLFSGDTLFHRGTFGRTDLPGSSPEHIKHSLEKLKKLNFKILCPGHGRE